MAGWLAAASEQEGGLVTAARKTVISAEGVDVQFLIDAEDSGGDATAFVTQVAPGGNTLGAHSHDWDETMYVTDGTLTFTIDGVQRPVAAGEAVFIRGGAVHTYENLADATASMLIVSTPGLNHESYFARVADVLNNPASRGRDEAVAELMAEYGVVRTSA
jgi:quercetin dioxygenase-like cupin family protein